MFCASQETDIVKSKRVLVSTLQSLRQAVATRDKAQRDMQALQLTIQKESEEFEKDYKQKVEVSARRLCVCGGV